MGMAWQKNGQRHKKGEDVGIRMDMGMDMVRCDGCGRECEHGHLKVTEKAEDGNALGHGMGLSWACE